MKSLTPLWILSGILLVAVGCGGSDGSSGANDPKNTLPNGFFLTASPAGAQPLSEVKKSANAGDDVVFRCRIGGRKAPFVDGRAIMIVIDPALPSCADNKGDTCPVPWDYCCETPETLVANTATVQLVGNDGKPLKSSLENNNGLSPLAWITVVGNVAEKDASGRFVVNAQGVFVEKQG